MGISKETDFQYLEPHLPSSPTLELVKLQVWMVNNHLEYFYHPSTSDSESPESSFCPVIALVLLSSVSHFINRPSISYVLRTSTSTDMPTKPATTISSRSFIQCYRIIPASLYNNRPVFGTSSFVRYLLYFSPGLTIAELRPGFADWTVRRWWTLPSLSTCFSSSTVSSTEFAAGMSLRGNMSRIETGTADRWAYTQITDSSSTNFSVLCHRSMSVDTNPCNHPSSPQSSSTHPYPWHQRLLPVAALQAQSLP